MSRNRKVISKAEERFVKSIIKLSFRTLYKILAVLFIIISSIFESLINGVYYTGRYIKNYRLVKSIGYSYDKLEGMIKDLDSRQFEIFICELFKALGYNAKVTQATCDGGKDVIIKDSTGEVTYVETKRWNEKLEIGRPLLQKLMGAAVGDGVDKAIFICTCKYNNNAYEYAAKIVNLELWDMTDILKKLLIINPHNIPRIFMKSLNHNNSKKIVQLRVD